MSKKKQYKDLITLLDSNWPEELYDFLGEIHPHALTYVNPLCNFIAEKTYHVDKAKTNIEKMRGHFVIDVESDGPNPSNYSMVSFGCVHVYNKESFYGKTAPINKMYREDALKISGVTRDEHKLFPPARETIYEFIKWLGEQIDFNKNRIVMWSDNPAFDFQWIEAYTESFFSYNPFGHSARRIGDLYAGITGKWNDHSSWKKFRETKHTHNPVNDAMGNVEALRKILRIPK